MPETPPLPSWVNNDRLLSQQPVVNDIVDRFKGRNGHERHNLVFLQAPTGTGKTLIAEMVRRQLRTTAIYTCTTKALQDQFAKDFDYAKVLKGRSNYPTVLGLVDEMGNTALDLSDAITCLDCTGANEECAWCGADWVQCPYLRARGRARSADVAVLNTAYMLTDAMGTRRFTYRGLTIIDEADKLENELLGFVEVNLSHHRRGRLGIGVPRLKTKEDTWVEFIREEAIPACRRYLDVLGELEHAKDRHTIREIKLTSELLGKLTGILKGSMYGRWMYDGYKDDREGSGDRHPVIFRPIFVDEYGDQFIWKMGQRFLLMSATILSDSVMAKELGVPDNFVYSTVEVPSVFPVENRPIHVVPVANMSYQTKDEDRPKMALAVSGVLKRHPDERILVHCVSYDLAKYLYDELRSMDHSRPLLIYYKSAEKDQVLDRYRNSDRAVLFAASMERGIDLPDDACRVQVIAKVPYPNLGDKRVNTRLYLPGGQAWFNMNTVRAIVQAAGRAVRHREDYAVTYILDSQFVTGIWKNNSLLFPKYFREALNFRFNPRLLTEV